MKIIIIGYGVAGKRYFRALKKKNIDLLIVSKSKKKIFYKKKNISIIYQDIKNILFEDVKAVIIASPLETHWFYLKIFLRKNVDIIIEKPVINNLSHFNKLKKLIKNFRNNFYINHSDLYNKNFLTLIKKKKFTSIKKINFYYGNNKNKYNIKENKRPISDWLPHVLAITVFFLKKINNYKILYFYREIKNNLIYEKILIQLYSGIIVSNFYFSNFPDTNQRNFLIELENGYLNFDAYNNKNYSSFSGKKSFLNVISKNTFDNLIDVLLFNINRQKSNNDFYLFEKYFMIQLKINSHLLRLKNT